MARYTTTVRLQLGLTVLVLAVLQSPMIFALKVGGCLLGGVLGSFKLYLMLAIILMKKC